MGFKAFFGFFVSLLQKAFDAAKANGLTDQLLSQALGLVREAATQFADNTERREWVVAALVANKVPESVARFAVEAALQVLKRELAER